MQRPQTQGLGAQAFVASVGHPKGKGNMAHSLSGSSAGERRFLCACIPKNVAVSSKFFTTQCPSGVAKEINAKWFVYSVPRYLTINNLYLELYSYGKIVKETKDGPDI